MEFPKHSKYKRKSDRGKIDVENVIRAIKAVKLENQTLRGASTMFNVPRTSLRRYVEKLSSKYADLSSVDDADIGKYIQELCSYAACSMHQVFSADEEKALVEYIKKCSNHYYGLSVNELRSLAYEFARKIGSKYPDSWDREGTSGRDWYYGFMRRHSEFTLRAPEQTSLNRVKSFSKPNVDEFFRHLDSVLSEYSFEPADIWNMDETRFPTVPTKIGKVISQRGQRRVGQISSQERGSMITMALAVSADGNFIPLFLLFPRKNMQSTFMENSSPGAVGFANGSGWMQQEEFVKYIEHFVSKTNCSKQSPKLLFLDNHSSHLSITALDFAVDSGLTLLSFPPHCSHRLQPLDVSVYGPVKAYYKSQCNAWQKNNAGKALEIRHIPSLIRSTLDLALTPRNIKSGFLAAGICPYNPDIFTDSDFVQAELNEENDRAVAEAEHNDEDFQRRITASVTNEITTNQSVTSLNEPTTSTSEGSNHSSILKLIGPMQAAPPVPKSNRGRRAMKSTILTSLENINDLREKKEKRDKSKTPTKRRSTEGKSKTPAKRGRPPKKAQDKSSPEETEDRDFCIICLKVMPLHLNKHNSIACIECNREVHLKCANITKSFFVCNNCESE